MGVAHLFPVDPSYAVPEKIGFKVLVSEFDSGVERRKLKSANARRRFSIDSRFLTIDQANSLRDFYIARQGPYDVFSFLPPVNHDRLISGLACGTGDGATTVFYLGNSATPPYYYRIYTAGTRNKVYLDGVEQSSSGYTLANDDANKRSTITFDTAPTNGQVVTVDVDRYLIVRFSEDPMQAALIAYSALESRVELIEVLRESI